MKLFLSVLACGLAWQLGAAEARALWISEVLYDAVGSDNGAVFVELYGTPGTDLDGFRLEGINGSGGAIGPIVMLTGLIPADGFFVVADTASGTTQVANADLLVNFDFQNGPDSIALLDPLSAIVDALGYGVFAPGDVFGGEGSAAPDPPAGSSLARVFANSDSGDNATDFVALESPTPGTGAVVPEPSSAWLLATSLGALVLRRLRTPR